MVGAAAPFASSSKLQRSGCTESVDALTGATAPNTTLTPIGQMQSDIRATMQQLGGSLGVHQAPVAFLVDPFAGWMPPRSLDDNDQVTGSQTTQPFTKYWRARSYRTATGGNIPYSDGDHLTHGLVSLTLPGYVDSSYMRDERGFVTATPFGDGVDMLKSDVGGWLLGRYSVVVVGSELFTNTGMSLLEVQAKLEEYISGGGSVVITAGQLAALPHGLRGVTAEGCRGGVDCACPRHPAGTVVVEHSTGERTREEHDFRLCPLSAPASVVTLASTSDGVPAAIRVTDGGTLTVLAAPFGVTAQLSETAVGLQVIVLTAVERIFHAAAASALAVLPYRREAYLANQPSSGCAVGCQAVSNVYS